MNEKTDQNDASPAPGETGNEPVADNSDQEIHDNEGTLSLALGGDSTPRAPTPPLPSSIGEYRILGVLGEGGMGVVYEAEQRNPSRRVALKVMRQGHTVDEVHTRLFQREAETLGRLKHPNIGAIYESGHTDDGHDFFAMELVRGQTLDAWVSSRPTPITTTELKLRLRVFCAIADGVHYAHQRGVIHRDLKPSNIIVKDATESFTASRSGSAVPLVKILDFGLARITDQDIGEEVRTQFGMLKGTVPYMSPEQAMGHPDEIDVRTDVYALGVILYEMLAGKRPYDTASAALIEALRVVCEEAPRPLSESWQGVRKLDADIETIVGKALEKEPPRRYGSVQAMSDDIDRYLGSQPIGARPPSALYQLRKFTGRNRALVGAASAAVVLLAAFAFTVTLQARRIKGEAERANREATRAREVSEFMIGLFDRSDPTLARGENLSARQVLDAGASRIAELADQPLTQAAFMETIGRVYTVLGAFDTAEPLLEQAVDIRDHSATEDELALAGGLHHLATFHDAAGQYDQAEEPIQRAVEIRERLLGEHPELANSLNTLGNVLWHQDRLEEAEVIHRRALAIREQAVDVGDPSIAQSLHNLGALRYFAGDYEEAEHLYRRSITIEEAAHGPDDWNLATSLHTLSIVYQDQDRFDDALALQKRALSIREKVLGPDHPHVALSLTTMGNIYRGLERPAAAEPLIRRAVRIAESAWGPNHGEVFWMRRSLVRTLIDLERFEEAEAEVLDLSATIERTSDIGSLPPILEILGDLRAREGRFDEAEASYRRSIALLKEEAPDSPYVGLATAGLARVQRDAGRPAEAILSYQEAIRLMEADWGTEDPDLRRAHAELEGLTKRPS